MALEISSVGASVKYCVETTAGTRPAAGYTAIPDITTAPEIAMSTDSLDASNLSDTSKRYIPGQQDPGSDKTFTANHTEAFITAWEALITAYETALAAGKVIWFEYVFPSPATKSFFWSGAPQALGTDAVDMNSIHTISPVVILSDIAGWAAKSTAA
jgi:hypothetical protein